MTKENSIITIPAQHFHINQMMDVCARNLVKNNRDKYSDEDFSKKGFLIVQLTEEIAKKFIEEKENHFACVAIDGEEVAGYLVGCDIKKSGIDLFSNVPELKKFQHENFFYHKQIVKNPEAKNVGTKLLLTLFDEMKNRGYQHIFCRIVLEPFYNEISISFHKKFGFKEVGVMQEDGAKLGIYLKTL